MRKTIHFSIVISTLVLSGGLVAAESSGTAGQGSKPQKEHSQKTSQTQGHSKSDRQHQDRTLSFNELPQAVQKTMRTEAGNLNLENIKQLTNNGQTCYEASFDKGAMKGKVTVGQDGSLLQYQESDQIALFTEVPKIQNTGTAMKDLPKAVQSSIQAQAGRNEVGDISKDTQDGKTIYHAAFNNEGIHTDLVLDEKGKVVLRSDETALFTAPLESAKTLSLEGAPEAVQKAIREHGGSRGKVSDIDKGTWNGQTAYRVMIDQNGTPRPLLVSESGQVLGSHQRDQATASGSPGSTQKSSGSGTHSSQSRADQAKQK